MPRTKKRTARKAAPTRDSRKTSRPKLSIAKKAKPRVVSAKAELKYIPWNTVELESLNPLLQRQLVVGEDIMVARVLMKKGCVIPLHSHYNEQVTYILEGALKFWIDGKEIVVNSGEVLTIPRNMPHKAEALVDTIDLDVFNPPRADWINKADDYLRGEKEKHEQDRLWKQG
jgi:quercetin dioxygenase-like cupin family protein